MMDLVITMRLKSGVYGLDEILDGGFINNTINAVYGSVGSGKTVFCLNFLLEGLENGENCAYVSFDLEPEDFLRLVKSMHWDISKEIEEERMKIVHFYTEDGTIIGEDLYKILKNYQRIAIDSFTPLIVSTEGKARNEVNWFFRNIRKSATALVTIEEPMQGYEAGSNVALYLADSVISLKSTGYSEPFSRTLRVVKHRMSSHSEEVYPYSIVEGVGIVLENRRCEGFEIEDIPGISRRSMEKLRRICREGYLTKEEFEKIKRRIKC